MSNLMGPRERRTARWRAALHGGGRGLAALWLSVGLLMLGVRQLESQVLFPIGLDQAGVNELLEAWIVLGLIVWTLRRLPLQEMVAGVGRTLVIVAGLLLALLVTGHFGIRAYPFVEWSMYTVPQDSLSYVEYRTIRQGRPDEHLSLGNVPTTSPRAFMQRMDEHLHRAEEGDERSVRLLEETFQALLDPGRDEGVEVRRCTVRGPTRESPSHCTTVFRFDPGAGLIAVDGAGGATR